MVWRAAATALSRQCYEPQMGAVLYSTECHVYGLLRRPYSRRSPFYLPHLFNWTELLRCARKCRPCNLERTNVIGSTIGRGRIERFADAQLGIPTIRQQFDSPKSNSGRFTFILSAGHDRSHPLKSHRFAIELVALALFAILTLGSPKIQAETFDTEFDPITGSDPGSHVKNWIKLAYFGARNYPYPIINISTERFKIRPLIYENLIVLPYKDYQRFATLTESQSCLEYDVNHHSPDIVGLFKSESRKGRRSAPCVIHQADACTYLSAISVLPTINWTVAELKPIHDLAEAIKCEESRSEYSNSAGNIPADH